MPSEEQFDRLTVISSSGPAFVYYLIESFQDILRGWDFSAEDANSIVTQLFLGSTLNAREASEPIQNLIDKVTSKKGITIEGVNSLRKDGLKKVMANAAQAAETRSKEIAKGI